MGISPTGTLYYNDINDLTGDCDFKLREWVNFDGVDFLRDGNVFAEVSINPIAGNPEPGTDV